MNLTQNHYIYYCGQKSLRINGVAIIVNKRVQNEVLGQKWQIYIYFQGKQFNITVIHIYALTSNAEEGEIEWFCEDLCWIMEKAREFQKKIYFCFIDYAKAFDCVDHNKLWKIL